MIKIRVALALTLAFACVGALSAKGGGGGIFFGFNVPSWHPSFMPEGSTSYQLYYYGGEGYGIDADGLLSGGFAMGLLSAHAGPPGMATENSIALGAIGGALVGQRLMAEPGMHVDIAARVGVGFFGGANGKYVTDSFGQLQYQSGDESMYLVGYFEPYIELGVRVFRWMRVSGALGYQYMPNLSPGKPLEDFWLSSPTLSFKASFGKF